MEDILAGIGVSRTKHTEFDATDTGVARAEMAKDSRKYPAYLRDEVVLPWVREELPGIEDSETFAAAVASEMVNLALTEKITREKPNTKLETVVFWQLSVSSNQNKVYEPPPIADSGTDYLQIIEVPLPLVDSGIDGSIFMDGESIKEKMDWELTFDEYSKRHYPENNRVVLVRDVPNVGEKGEVLEITPIVKSTKDKTAGKIDLKAMKGIRVRYTDPEKTQAVFTASFADLGFQHHETLVSNAVSEGFPVPERVLSEYPEIEAVASKMILDEVVMLETVAEKQDWELCFADFAKKHYPEDGYMYLPRDIPGFLEKGSQIKTDPIEIHTKDKQEGQRFSTDGVTIHTVGRFISGVTSVSFATLGLPNHEATIRKALEEEKPVPMDVLSEYPNSVFGLPEAVLETGVPVTVEVTTTIEKNETTQVISNQTISEQTNRENMETEKDTIYSKLEKIRPILVESQYQYLKNPSILKEHGKTLTELENTYSEVPKIDEQDALKNQAYVFLHYFYGSSDWYITELDKESNQAFGYVILNGDEQMAEFGYIDINELRDIPQVNLDFFFEIQPLYKVLDGVSKPLSENGLEVLRKIEVKAARCGASIEVEKTFDNPLLGNAHKVCAALKALAKDVMNPEKPNLLVDEIKSLSTMVETGKDTTGNTIRPVLLEKASAALVKMTQAAAEWLGERGYDDIIEEVKEVKKQIKTGM